MARNGEPFIAELNKKWAETKSVSLRIISDRRYPKTGYGKKEKEPWFVDLVLDVLGVDTALVEGIIGKYDKHKLSVNRVIVQ